MFVQLINDCGKSCNMEIDVLFEFKTSPFALVVVFVVTKINTISTIKIKYVPFLIQ